MRLSSFLLVLAIQLVGCSKTTDNSKTAAFTQADLLAAEVAFCSQGFKLKEAAVSGEFKDMGDGVKVFGFSSGKGECAVDHDVHYNNLGLTWFDLVDVNSCVPNGSLWEITGNHTATPNHYFDLKMFQGTRTLSLTGARDLSAVTVRDLSGLRPLKCTQE
jgi:hypothetical protein